MPFSVKFSNGMILGLWSIWKFANVMCANNVQNGYVIRVCLEQLTVLPHQCHLWFNNILRNSNPFHILRVCFYLVWWNIINIMAIFVQTGMFWIGKQIFKLNLCIKLIHIFIQWSFCNNIMTSVRENIKHDCDQLQCCKPVVMLGECVYLRSNWCYWQWVC